jgi:TolA-binding protein
MQSKVKLTKRQMKEDKFTTFMLTSKDQLQANWQYYLLGVVAVIVLVAGLAYTFTYRGSQQVRAAEQLSKAMLDYAQGNNQIALLAFAEIIDEYSGTTAAEQATFLSGTVNLEDRKYDEAARYFTMYLDKYNDDPLDRASACAGLAVVAENQGRSADAAAQYVRAAEAYPDGPSASEYQCNAVRSFLDAGDMESARARLTIMEDKFGDDPLTLKAKRLFSEKGNS